MFEGHPLFSLENVYRAYRRCRRRKRGTLNALRFEANLEENLVALHEELSSGTYRPGRSMAFLVEKPKRREIFAADFRDRVVHHVLVGHLEPGWERRFIHDSYACRAGKGTHAGVERLRTFLRQATANNTRRAWYLQLDVRGYFITLSRDILFERIAAKERDAAVLWLARLLIFHEPTADCLLRGAKRSDFERLPEHKTLFKAAPRCGLPIGNLTSQFFANVYLDALDQFVKHTLRAGHYVRYCDDLVLISQDKSELERWEAQIEGFVGERLGLRLNSRRKLRPVADGVDFLGYVIRPDYVLVRKRVVSALRSRLMETEGKLKALGMAEYEDGHSVFVWPAELIEETRAWLNSYLGHLRQASCFRLVRALRERFVWLDEYFRWNGPCVGLRCPASVAATKLREQERHFERCLPDHVIVMQLGRFWKLLPGPVAAMAEVWDSMNLLKRRFHKRDERTARDVLWRAAVPVAWLGETERRVGAIAERALVCRWGCRDEATVA
jgi:RNA-directed DNA polymerase